MVSKYGFCGEKRSRGVPSVLKCEKLYPNCVRLCMKNEHQSGLTVSDLLRELHHRVEAKERGRISQAAMASRLGISSRTYLEYLRGTNSPVGMRVVFDLLCMLDDEAALQLINRWRDERQLLKQSPTEIAT